MKPEQFPSQRLTDHEEWLWAEYLDGTDETTTRAVAAEASGQAMTARVVTSELPKDWRSWTPAQMDAWQRAKAANEPRQISEQQKLEFTDAWDDLGGRRHTPAR